MNSDDQSELPRYDYVSPGLAIVRPDAAFPEMMVGDTQVVRWPFLRRWVEQNWYTDRRNPDAGFASRDEVAILYNAARLVRGKPCLEIGAWRGWSAVHLALGCGALDVVDPILADPGFFQSIHRSCEAAGVLDAITFHAGSSPAAVDELAQASGKHWSLIFVDGDHEGEAPLLDARAAMRHAADTAMVFFHDLASPYVAAGLHAMRDAGWRTMLYQTMQIVGVAWRGDIEPPDHTPDPNVFWTLPAHLDGYHVSNWKRPSIRSDGGWWPGMTPADRRDAAMMRAQAAENAASALSVETAALQEHLAHREAALEGQQRELLRRDIQMAHLGARLAAQQVEAKQRDTHIEHLRVSVTTELAEVARRDAQIAGFRTQIASQHAEIGHLRERLASQEATVARLRAELASQEAEIATRTIASFVIGRRVLAGLLRRSMPQRLEAMRSHASATQCDHLLHDKVLHPLLRRRALLGLARRPRLEREAIVRGVLREPLQARLGAEAAGGNAVANAIGAEAGETAWAGNVRNGIGAGAAHEGNATVNADMAQADVDNSRGEIGEARAAGPCNASTVPHTVAIAARIRDSDLFDAAFYEREAGISGRGLDPATHYVEVGDAIGLRPSPSFDPGYYAARYPDVVAARFNKLLHYISYGRGEGRHPLPAGTFRIKKERMSPRRENVVLTVHEASRTGAPILAWNIGRILAEQYNVFTVMLGDGVLVPEFEALSAGVFGPIERERRHPTDIEHGLGQLLDSGAFKYAIMNSGESRAALDACVKRRIPVVLLVHEFASLVHPTDALRRTFDLASDIVFPAEVVARSAMDLHPPLRNRPLRIIPQGVCALPVDARSQSGGSWAEVPAVARARKDGAFIVLGAGTVDFRKGVDLFLTTAAAVRREREGRKVQFVWIGYGYKPHEEKAYSIYLHEQLQRSGLQDCVTILEDVADLEPIYALADAFLLASRLDPMPNVAIDAAHRGIPIICFRDASGIADLLLTDTATSPGVVPYLDAAAAGQVVLSLAGNQDLRAQMADATRRLARATFDMTRYVEAIDALGSAAWSDAPHEQRKRLLQGHVDRRDEDMDHRPAHDAQGAAMTLG